MAIASIARRAIAEQQAQSHPLQSRYSQGSEEFDLFVIYSTADASFVREYLLPALQLPRSRVLLIDELPIGGLLVYEVERGVSRSRYTLAVLSPAYLKDHWADFGELLASHLSMNDIRMIPLRLVDCELPFRLAARIALDFTDPGRWEWETARLRNLLRNRSEITRPIPYPYPCRRPRRRRTLRSLGAAAAGALLMLVGSWWWPQPVAMPPPSGDMVRIHGARVRPGVSVTASQPHACSGLTASGDRAVTGRRDSAVPVDVASFDLDRLEVTNAQYAAWLNANIDRWKVMPRGIVTTRTEPTIALIRAEMCGDGLMITPAHRAHVTTETAHLPVMCVSWHGANEYCRAHGKRMPLGVECELAAMRTQRRLFRWGAGLPRIAADKYQKESGFRCARSVIDGRQER